MIPELSLGTAILLILALSFAFLMLRGLVRMIVGSICLGLSGWAAYVVWQRAPDLSVQFLDKSVTAVIYGLPIIAFLSVFLFLRFIVMFLTKPLGMDKPPVAPKGGIFLRLILALIPTSLISFIGAVIVYHFGSVAEVNSAATDEEPSSILGMLKSGLDSLPDSWKEKLDPFSDPNRVKLAKLIAAESKITVPEPVIDEATGQPIPRAIIVEDHELQTLAREKQFGALLRHPRLKEFLNDPKIKNALEHFQD
ncbi:MAG: hypothetical protein ACQCXQ_06580 [Verrucomicrobiales bacterium]|nr:hypothetical protein [Verrucomicrobiota bacterium JB025]